MTMAFLMQFIFLKVGNFNSCRISLNAAASYNGTSVHIHRKISVFISFMKKLIAIFIVQIQAFKIFRLFCYKLCNII